MKLRIKYIVIGFIISGLASIVNANNHSSYSFNKLAKELCENAADNQVFHIRTNLRNSKLDLRNIYDEVECQGSDLLKVAEAHEADDVVRYIKLKVKRN
ncbi:DUF3718 domain-containing protein [Aliikangiella sp. IMCC44359]|uniref:DUF3718 domain-containing protein n=1 Tax=Aliikangiella sp. IMCC44359 TaxID=3459125 RepID=UPI00403B0026